MKECIYREEAIRICERLLNHEEKLQSVERETLIAVKKYLENIPTADVRPVVRGKWETISFMTVRCSNCKETFHELEGDNFCPNCGADMMEINDVST